MIRLLYSVDTQPRYLFQIEKYYNSLKCLETTFEIERFTVHVLSHSILDNFHEEILKFF